MINYIAEPFDRTYVRVTTLIRPRIRKLVYPESRWLARITIAFWRERDRWSDAALEPYFSSCEKLRQPLLRLIAGAFLHIAYDLPRVVADHWPGAGRWRSGPDENRGETIYFLELRPVFDEALIGAARDRRVVGSLAGAFARGVPAPVLGNAAIWVKHLREAAWRHGRRLSKMSSAHRNACEQRMRRAMQTAIAHTLSSGPFHFALPGPPDEAIAAIGIADIVPSALNRAWIGAFAVSILALLAVWLAWRRSRQRLQMEAFIAEFGARVSEYMDMAVTDSENFESYIERRAHEISYRTESA